MPYGPSYQVKLAIIISLYGILILFVGLFSIFFFFISIFSRWIRRFLIKSEMQSGLNISFVLFITDFCILNVFDLLAYLYIFLFISIFDLLYGLTDELTAIPVCKASVIWFIIISVWCGLLLFSYAMINYFGTM